MVHFRLDDFGQDLLQLRLRVREVLNHGDHLFVTGFAGMRFQVHVREDGAGLRRIPHIAEVAFARLMATGGGIQLLLELFFGMTDCCIKVQGHAPLTTHVAEVTNCLARA